MSNPISLKRNYIFKLAYQILSLIVPLVTAPYVSRVLGAEGVGAYSYASSVMTYFTMFAALGTFTYGTKEIAQCRDDRQQLSNTFWGIELMTIGTTAIACVAWLILSGLSNGYRAIFLALLPTLIATAADISWLYTGLEKVHYTVTINLICKVAGACATFALVKERGDLLKYVLIMSASTCLGNMSMWLFLPRTVSSPQLKQLNIGMHFRETLKYFVTSVAISVYTVLDKTMIGLLTHDSAQNGYYEQACKIVNIVKPLAFTTINDIMAPRMSYLYSKGRMSEIKELINTSLSFELMISVGCCFGLMAVAKVFVPMFFGAGYEPVIILLQLMSPLLIIISISNCIGSHYYVPSGNIATCTKYTIVGSVINLIVNVPLIILFKAKGAVMASLISEGVISILYVAGCREQIKYTGIWHILFKKLLAGMIMLVCCTCIDKLLTCNAILKLMVEVLAGAGSYIILLLIMRDEAAISIMRYTRNFLSKKIYKKLP